MDYVIVFITGSGNRSIDQAMVIEPKGFDEEERRRILTAAAEMGVENPTIIGQAPVEYHIAQEMGDGRIYIG
jgi:hypothetical protein